MKTMPELVEPVVAPGGLIKWAQPTLVVDELELRPWRDDDAPAVVDAYRDPDIQRWHVRSMTADEAEHWVRSWAEQGRAVTGAGWAVVSDGAVAARMGLRELDLADGYGEASYWVRPGYRGRGIATRGLGAMTDWFFGHVGLHRIDLEHSVANPGWCRVAIKAGFAYEGTRHSSARHADGWHDMHVHARINPAG
jgi:ribosomal-protein-alanine N-acetyltransferase